MNVLLFVKDSQRAREVSEKVQKLIRSFGVTFQVFVNERSKREKPEVKDVDLLVVVGGDGTFLAGARLASREGVPLLGINVGRFGFLTEVELEETEEVFKLLLEGRIEPQKRMMLSGSLLRGSQELYLGDYLNDVVVSKESLARMVELEIELQRERVLRVYGDGVIVSTPTGSTAYALSAGGPILYPLMEALLFVPICPHTLSNRPLVVPPDFEIRLINLSEDHMAYLTLDGQEGMSLRRGDVVVVKKSINYCFMYPNPRRSFFSILKEKLRWG